MAASSAASRSPMSVPTSCGFVSRTSPEVAYVTSAGSAGVAMAIGMTDHYIRMGRLHRPDAKHLEPPLGANGRIGDTLAEGRVPRDALDAAPPRVDRIGHDHATRLSFVLLCDLCGF